MNLKTSGALPEHGLAEGLLLRICRLRPGDPQVTPECMASLRLVMGILTEPRRPQHARLEAAMTLLASALGQLTQFNPTHLPFGYHGPCVQSRDWIEREALERTGIQVVGLMWQHITAEAVAAVVEQAVCEAVRLGFLEQRAYDAWRPGMPSGSGWKTAVTATPYGITRALLFTESADESRSSASGSHKTKADAGSEDNLENEIKAASGPSYDGSSQENQYRNRFTELAGARCIFTDDPEMQKNQDLWQTAVRLSEQLAVWVEAISDAEADPHPSGGYWTGLGDDLEGMLGPVELSTGVFEDEWTPLLTQLQMTGLGEVAETLDHLAKEAIPEARSLARSMDAVAYLRNGGPRDALYDVYIKHELAVHEAGVWHGRQNVARRVMRVVNILRTLADGGGTSPVSDTAASARTPKPRPRRGTRAANIEKLEKALTQHLLAARDHAQSLCDRGLDAELLPRPTQKELARVAGLTASDVSRCLKDPCAKLLRILWDTAACLEDVMCFRHQR